MELAELVASWSSCYQENRHVGAVIVKNKRVLTTGYNGASSGIKSCVERGTCLRRELNIESGTRHEICYGTHAEQNAIIQAAKLGICIDGGTLYCTHQPCVICAKMIINAGIKRIDIPTISHTNSSKRRESSLQNTKIDIVYPR